MPVLDKKTLNDLQAIQYSYNLALINDFDNYWNGGIPETVADDIANPFVEAESSPESKNSLK